MTDEPCPSCDRDLSYSSQPGHECYTYEEWNRQMREQEAIRAACYATHTREIVDGQVVEYCHKGDCKYDWVQASMRIRRDGKGKNVTVYYNDPAFWTAVTEDDR